MNTGSVFTEILEVKIFVPALRWPMAYTALYRTGVMSYSQFICAV